MKFVEASRMDCIKERETILIDKSVLSRAVSMGCESSGVGGSKACAHQGRLVRQERADRVIPTVFIPNSSISQSKGGFAATLVTVSVACLSLLKGVSAESAPHYEVASASNEPFRHWSPENFLMHSGTKKMDLSLSGGNIKDVPLQFVDVGQQIEDAHELLEITKRIRELANKNCLKRKPDLSIPLYQHESGKFTNHCPNIRWAHAGEDFVRVSKEARRLVQVFEEITNYFMTFGELGEFGYEVDYAIFDIRESLRAMAKPLEVDIQGFVEKLSKFDNGSLNEEGRSFLDEIKVLVDRGLTIFERSFGELHRQYLLRVEAQKKGGGDARKIAAQRTTQALAPDKRKRLGIKALEIVGNLYLQLVGGLIGITAALNFLPKNMRFWKKTHGRPSIEVIIAKQREVIRKIKDFENKVKKCEEASDKAAVIKVKRERYEAFPMDWMEPPTPIGVRESLINANQKSGKKRNRSIIGSVAEQLASTRSAIPEYPWEIDVPWSDNAVKPIYRKGGVKTVKINDKHIIGYAMIDMTEVKRANKFEEHEIRSIKEVHEDGVYASHGKGSVGYKCFTYKDVTVWEVRLTGPQRLYGTKVKATPEGRAVKIPSLIVFDVSFGGK